MIKLTLFQLALIVVLSIAQGVLIRDWAASRAEIRAFEATQRENSKQVALRSRKA